MRHLRVLCDSFPFGESRTGMKCNMYILFIIDDDDLFRESIRERIERDGVRLDVATDSMALSAASKWLWVMI